MDGNGLVQLTVDAHGGLERCSGSSMCQHTCETPFFTSRERAALAWTEAVTNIGRDGVDDALYDDARAQFSEKELIDLTVAVIAINAWNRMAVTFRSALSNHTKTDGPDGDDRLTHVSMPAH